MPLNKQKGNMYGFVTHTWNPIKGRCLHGCTYCYMQPKWKYLEDTGHSTKLRLDEKELKTNLGEGNFIFVGSGTDMWAETVPKNHIQQVMDHIDKYPKNQYLFQTKYPLRYGNNFRENEVLCITLETNLDIRDITRANRPTNRAVEFGKIKHNHKMVTIEPIIDFDLDIFVDLIKDIKPEQVNIGADSGHNNLPEPSKEKVLQLIAKLEKFTKVHQKPNLKRLIK